MERLQKGNRLDPIAKLHIVYGTIIMIMSVAFIVTLVTMKSTYKGEGTASAQGEIPPVANMQQGDSNVNTNLPPADPAATQGILKPGAGGMPPFLKKQIEGYKSALIKNPKDTKALVGLANMYYDSGQYPKAIVYYEKMVEIDPKNANARADLGTCYFYTNVLDKASFHLKKAVEDEPSNLNARYNLGIVYKNQGKISDAKAEWEAMKPYLKTEAEKKKLDSILENLNKSKS